MKHISIITILLLAVFSLSAHEIKDGVLYISDGTTTIKQMAFKERKDFTKVVFPPSVTVIGDAAFQNCINLKEVSLNEGLTTIKYRAFKNTAIEEVTIPSTVISFGKELFKDCKNFKTIRVDKYSEPHAYYLNDSHLAFTDKKPKQTKEQWLATAKNNIIDDGILYVGMGVKKIYDYQYRGNQNIKEIRFKDTTTEITAIGSSAFRDCKGLTKLVIPGNVKAIGDNAFLGCSNLEEAILEEGVEKIIVYAFQNCSKLNSITLPISAKSITPDGIFWQNKSKRIFHCHLGSTAYNMAVKNGYSVDIIGVD